VPDNGDSGNAVIVAIVGISGFLAIGALCMICWFVFSGKSDTDLSGDSVDQAATADGQEGKVSKKNSDSKHPLARELAKVRADRGKHLESMTSLLNAFGDIGPENRSASTSSRNADSPAESASGSGHRSNAASRIPNSGSIQTRGRSGGIEEHLAPVPTHLFTSAEHRPKKVTGNEVDVALQRLRSNDDEKRAALDTLAGIDLSGRESEVLAALRPVIGSSNSWVVAEEILGVLERCPGSDRVEMVIASLGDKTIANRAYIRALGRWKDPRAIEPIAKRLTDQGIQKDAARALILFGPASERAALDQLKNADSSTSTAVWQVLAQIGGDETMTTYRKLKSAGNVDKEAEATVSLIQKRLQQSSP
jgi:hypothetical protein